MSYTQALTQNPPGGPSASGLLSALLAAKASHCVTVPDFVQFALHDKILAKNSGLPNVFATNENQAITMATGMYIAGANPVVVMQNQGFLNCINTLRGTCIDSAIPMVFMVGQFGREAENIGQPTKQSRRSMVRLLEPLLETLGLHYWNIEEETDIGNVAKAFEHAATAKTAAVLIVSRHVTWQ